MKLNNSDHQKTNMVGGIMKPSLSLRNYRQVMIGKGKLLPEKLTV